MDPLRPAIVRRTHPCAGRVRAPSSVHQGSSAFRPGLRRTPKSPATSRPQPLFANHDRVDPRCSPRPTRYQQRPMSDGRVLYRTAERASSQLSSNETGVDRSRLRTLRPPRWPSISDDAADDGSRHPYRGRTAMTLIAVRSPPTWRFSPTRSCRCAGAAGPDRRQPTQ